MNKCVERLYNGIVKENPTFVLMLGMCPTLAVTTAAINGVGMGLASTAVLTLSNIMISMLRKVIPGRVTHYFRFIKETLLLFLKPVIIKK